MGPATRASARAIARMLATASLLGLVPCAAGASAEARTQIGVAPSILELRGTAGETIERAIVVSTGEAASVSAAVAHADVELAKETYSPTLIRDDAEEPAANSTRGWFTTPKISYRIPAGGSLTLPVTIAIPDNVPSGTYVGAVLVRTLAPAGGSGQVATAVEAGVLVFISVSGASGRDRCSARLTCPVWSPPDPSSRSSRSTTAGTSGSPTRARSSCAGLERRTASVSRAGSSCQAGLVHFGPRPGSRVVRRFGSGRSARWDSVATRFAHACASNRPAACWSSTARSGSYPSGRGSWEQQPLLQRSHRSPCSSAGCGHGDGRRLPCNGTRMTSRLTTRYSSSINR